MYLDLRIGHSEILFWRNMCKFSARYFMEYNHRGSVVLASWKLRLDFMMNAHSYFTENVASCCVEFVFFIIIIKITCTYCENMKTKSEIEIIHKEENTNP